VLALGSRPCSEPIRSLDATKALTALRNIEARGHRESAHRARHKLRQVMRYGVARSTVSTKQGGAAELELVVGQVYAVRHRRNRAKHAA
jgi:hypothetical protein